MGADTARRYPAGWLRIALVLLRWGPNGEFLGFL